MSENTPNTNTVKSAYINAEAEVSGRGEDHLAEMEAEFDRWLADVVREASEKAWDLAWTELRMIPHWWNTEDQRGGFDIPPMGLGPSLETGAFMEVRKVMLDNPFRAE